LNTVNMGVFNNCKCILFLLPSH